MDRFEREGLDRYITRSDDYEREEKMIDRDETVTLDLTIDETIQIMLALKNEVNLAADKAREASREGLRKYWLRELDKVTPILQKVTSALAGDRVAGGEHDNG